MQRSIIILTTVCTVISVILLFSHGMLFVLGAIWVELLWIGGMLLVLVFKKLSSEPQKGVK